MNLKNLFMLFSRNDDSDLQKMVNLEAGTFFIFLTDRYGEGTLRELNDS